ncbi:MAG: ATP-binding protein [Deltaproteobacteria bacterium]|nr:ATP-binding protein [Deltaproteobacteria bacterium]
MLPNEFLEKLKSRFMSLSLKTQLLVILLFLLVVSLSSLTIIYARTEDLIINKVTENIEDITKAIQISVEELTYRGDSTARLKAYVEMLNKKGIKEISIISNSSEVIASSNPKKVGRKEPIDEKFVMPDFTVNEFKSKDHIEKLCNIILLDGFNQQLNSQINTIDWLNELLRVPEFYNFIAQKKDLFKVSNQTRIYIEELKKSYDETKSEKDLVRLNRFLLEEFYPLLVPKRVKLDNQFLRKKDLFIVARLGEEGKRGTQKPYNVIMPVSVKGKHLGYIHISMVLDDYTLLQKKNHIKRVITTVSVFALGIILCLVLAEKYTRPIKKVAEASRAIIEGDLKKIEDFGRKDEIGTLIRSYNEMIEKMIERKRLEEKLKESEQLSLIGQLSSGIAHEIRNPLNFISLSVSHVKESIQSKENLEEKEEIVNLLDNVMREIQRVNELIHNFLFLGKKIRLTMEKTEIKKIIDEALYLLKDKLVDGIEITVKGEDEVFFCDREYIRLSILNLLLNAIQAVDGNGKIMIEAGTEGSFKYISVMDNGVGIDKECLDKIFEPYFSTKKFGIGLGLTLTKRFVTEHGGKIIVESERGLGTKVKILLPNHEA